VGKENAQQILNWIIVDISRIDALNNQNNEKIEETLKEIINDKNLEIEHIIRVGVRASPNLQFFAKFSD